jgi:prepilin peptidase CpaA
MILQPIFLMPLVALLAMTVYGDLREQRIRNVWTLGGASLAILVHLFIGGLEGLQTALLGLGTGLGLLLPFYAMKGMAAGDVKLMGAVGALVGPKLALIAVAATLIAGGVLAVGYLVIRGDIGRWLQRWNGVLANLVVARGLGVSYLPPAADEVAGQRFPYALAIAAGTLIAAVWFSGQAPAYMQMAG